MANFWGIVKSKLANVMKRNIDYNLFPYHFFLLSSSALWWPRNGSRLIRIILKRCFLLIVFFEIALSIQMVAYSTFKSFKVIHMVYYCSVISALYKSVLLVGKRDVIISLTEEYGNTDNWLNTKDKREIDIYRKFKIELRFEQQSLNYSHKIIRKFNEKLLIFSQKRLCYVLDIHAMCYVFINVCTDDHDAQI